MTNATAETRYIRGFLLGKDADGGWNRRLPDLALVYLLFSIGYLYWYLIEPAVPANDLANWKGWWGWWDQGQYWKTAGELAGGVIGNAQYWWGYPLIGAVFYKLNPAHAFFFPNYAFGFLVVLFFYLSAARLATRIEAIVLTVVLILGSRTMMYESLIVPWNTIITYAAVFSITYLLVVSTASTRGALFCIGLVGLTALVRPQDTPIVFAYLVSALYFRQGRGTFVKYAAMSGAVVLAFAAVLAGLNLAAFGKVVPPYVGSANAVGMSLSDIGFRLYQLYVDGTLIHGNGALPPGRTTPFILEKLPLAALSLAGGWLLWRRMGNHAWTVVGACLASILLYVSFNAAGNPPHFWSFLLFHYFWWTGVLLSLLGYYFLREWALRHAIPRGAKVVAALSLAALALCGFGEESTFFFTADRDGAPQKGFAAEQDGDVARFKFQIEGNNERGLRLAFRSPPPRHLTVPGAEAIVSIKYNGDELRYWRDYIVSQDGNTVNVHLYRPPPPGAVLAEASFKGLGRPQLAYAQGIRERLQPSATMFRLTRWMFGTTGSPFASPYLAPPYRIGDLLKLGAEAGTQAFLLEGWSGQEAGFTWSIRERATIRMGIDPREISRDACVVEVDFGALGPSSVSVYMNGVRVGRPYFGTGERKTVRFGPCAIIDGDDLIMTFEIDQLRSPLLMGLNKDTRSLGIALFSVRVTRD